MEDLFCRPSTAPVVVYNGCAVCVVCGQYVVVGEERFVHVWNAVDSLQFVCTISLHSTAGFPLAVSKTCSLLATASTIHTALKV